MMPPGNMIHPQLPEILAKLRQHLKATYADHLVSLILFGSQARGEANTDSDDEQKFMSKDLVISLQPLNLASAPQNETPRQFLPLAHRLATGQLRHLPLCHLAVSRFCCR